MQTKLTNQELLKKLEESYLDFTYKESIAPLIPELNESETEELLGLIEESNKIKKVIKEIEEKHSEKMRELNREYDAKMKQVVHEESQNARKQFEELENKEDTSKLAEIESEMNEI